MNTKINATVGCVLAGEYLDEGVVPQCHTVHRSEVDRPKVVAEYLDQTDQGDQDKDTRVFTVLFKDGRVVTVLGHFLRHLPHPIAGQDLFSIVVRTPGEEVAVGLFKSQEVAGIFQGEVRSERKPA